MPSTLLQEVLWLFLTTSGESMKIQVSQRMILTDYRLLDKIAKDIMVCENKTVTRWDGTIGEYKNYLRKKMISAGAV